MPCEQRGDRTFCQLLSTSRASRAREETESRDNHTKWTVSGVCERAIILESKAIELAFSGMCVTSGNLTFPSSRSMDFIEKAISGPAANSLEGSDTNTPPNPPLSLRLPTEKVHTLVFSPCHRKRSKISTEVKLGATVASMFWGEQPAIETTTSMDILVLNYVAYT